VPSLSSTPPRLPVIATTRALRAFAESKIDVSSPAWRNTMSPSKSYRSVKARGGSRGGAGAAAPANASRPALGPGGRGGSNVRL